MRHAVDPHACYKWDTEFWSLDNVTMVSRLGVDS